MLSSDQSLISRPERAMRADVGQPVDAVKAAERAAEVVRAAKRLVESEAERERVAQGLQQLRDTGLDALRHESGRSLRFNRARTPALNETPSATTAVVWATSYRITAAETTWPQSTATTAADGVLPGCGVSRAQQLQLLWPIQASDGGVRDHICLGTSVTCVDRLISTE